LDDNEVPGDGTVDWAIVTVSATPSPVSGCCHCPVEDDPVIVFHDVVIDVTEFGANDFNDVILIDSFLDAVESIGKWK
jgi:hypothetical protein